MWGSYNVSMGGNQKLKYSWHCCLEFISKKGTKKNRWKNIYTLQGEGSILFSTFQHKLEIVNTSSGSSIHPSICPHIRKGGIGEEGVSYSSNTHKCISLFLATFPASWWSKTKYLNSGKQLNMMISALIISLIEIGISFQHPQGYCTASKLVSKSIRDECKNLLSQKKTANYELFLILIIANFCTYTFCQYLLGMEVQTSTARVSKQKWTMVWCKQTHSFHFN